MKKFLIILFLVICVGLLLLIELPSEEGISKDSRQGVAGTLPEEIMENTNRATFIDDFEAPLVFDAANAWKNLQLVRGSVDLVPDPGNTANTVARSVAGKRTSSGKVGKADLIKRYTPIPARSTIIVSANFYFPEDSNLDSLHLMDIECGECGVDTNPGPRLYLREGRLRIDRGKIGINESFNQSVDVTLKHNQWHHIKWSLTTGEGDAGQSVVWLDGQKVIDESGTNILTQSVLDQYGVSLTSDHIDSVQVGLTANSNNSEQTLYFDDVTIEVKE